MNTQNASGKYLLTEKQKSQVAEARAEFESGNSVSGEQLMADIEKWLVALS